MAHGQIWSILPTCFSKREEQVRKLLCRNRLRGFSWKEASQNKPCATVSKQPVCPKSGHEPLNGRNLDNSVGEFAGSQEWPAERKEPSSGNAQSRSCALLLVSPPI